MKKKTILYCLALGAFVVFTSAAFAQEPTLSSVEVKFDTTTDNKDQKTTLDVYVKTSDGHEVAKSEGNEGHWNNNSSHTVTLEVEGNPTKEEVANGSVSLTIHPQRRDQWAFNYKATLKFSDHSFITKEYDGCVLNQHGPTRTDSFK
jgi:hypothetical protein